MGPTWRMPLRPALALRALNHGSNVAGALATGAGANAPTHWVPLRPALARCAARELKEETGLRARIGELFGVYAGFDDPRARAILVLYMAERTGGRLAAGDDALEARFFPVDRTPRDLAFQAHRHALNEF